MKQEAVMDRVQLRKQLRADRNKLSSEQQQVAAEQLAKVVCSQPLFQQSQHIALYLASDGEISPEWVVQQAWDRGKQCYLPVLDPVDKQRMHFQSYQPDTPMVENRFGIREPAFDLSLAIAPEALDLVLMPLTGFDEQGNRLGMGGGFYDRTFAFVKGANKPQLIGLAHECQKRDQIPVEDWDIPVLGVATDKQFY